MANPVEFVGRDARNDVFADHIEYVGSEPAGDPHPVLFVLGFDRHSHWR
jgi:hypothetical protein